MNRTFTYTIENEFHGISISSYLKNKGFSSQNLVELKKMPESVLVNGKWVYLTQRVEEGDTLTIQIVETALRKNSSCEAPSGYYL